MASYNWMMNSLLEDDSDGEYEKIAAIIIEEEREHLEQRRRGSIPGHITIDRNTLEGHARFFQDYFAPNPTYPPYLFRRRFRMHRPLFLRISEAVEAFDPFFKQRRNAAGKLGLSSLQKITAAFRMLAYGSSADSLDESVRIGESTTIESLKRFVKAVVAQFGGTYLRSPTTNDVHRLLAIGEHRGFPGMLGSIDCMHWKWKNCPTAWQGMYTGHVHSPTIILEAIASQDLWIWHAFFGLPGSHNDINVLDRSFVFSELSAGRAPKCDYCVNGNNYTMGYYLADGIYPSWSVFVKTIPAPQGNKRKLFSTAQESIRKDVERAFGVLQARFAIIRGPARFWDEEVLKDIMMACVVMHNMIIEDEREIHTNEFIYDGMEEVTSEPLMHGPTPELEEFIRTHHQIRDRTTHSQLQTDLVEHQWQLHGAGNH